MAYYPLYSLQFPSANAGGTAPLPPPDNEDTITAPATLPLVVIFQLTRNTQQGLVACSYVVRDVTM